MTKSTFHFEFNDLNLSVSQIEGIIGYKEGEDSALVSGLIGEILKESEKICNIKAEYIIYKDILFNYADKSLNISEINFQIKRIVFSQIKGSDSVVVFLCTAGKEIGIKSREAMHEKDLLRGYIYDVVGSEIVEAAADLMQNELEKSVISSGKKITNRYSPGYCGWYVGEQHKLFQLVPDNYCGIRLTPSALMDPVKSVSGIIGIGEQVKMNPYTCGLCDQKDCIYRKKRQ
ncbi:MAG: methionine synthase [Bacteroidales bacterium]|nr:methionine synthase [Bacteroidales bacterium]